MLLHELMKVDRDVFLIEDSFDGLEQNQKSLDYMGQLCILPEGSVPAALKISDGKGNGLGIAFKNRHPEGISGLSCRIRTRRRPGGRRSSWPAKSCDRASRAGSRFARSTAPGLRKR